MIGMLKATVIGMFKATLIGTLYTEFAREHEYYMHYIIWLLLVPHALVSVG